MKNYKITVSYDGTRYKGWQVLKSTDATIQGKLQMVLSALAGHPVEAISSGRCRFRSSKISSAEKCSSRWKLATCPIA